MRGGLRRSDYPQSPHNLPRGCDRFGPKKIREISKKIPGGKMNPA
jgi:hypothetical protein